MIVDCMILNFKLILVGAFWVVVERDLLINWPWFNWKEAGDFLCACVCGRVLFRFWSGLK